MRIANLEFTASKIDLNEYRDPSQLLAAHQTKTSYTAQAEELRDLLKAICDVDNGSSPFWTTKSLKNRE